MMKEVDMNEFRRVFGWLVDSEGRYITNNRCQEILRLDAMLTERNIPHVCQKLYNGWQVIYPEDGGNRVMDAIEHYGSFGEQRDLLEIVWFLPEDEMKGGIRKWDMIFP